MKLITKLPVVALALGMPTAYAEPPNPVFVSPFGTVARNAAPAALSVQQAKAALSATGMRKSSAAVIEKMLARESNEMLVLFKDEKPAQGTAGAASVQGRALQTAAFQTTRRNVRLSLINEDVDFVHDYTNMPTALVRTRSRAALVKLLNDPRVEGVMENVNVPPATGKSLPLINHPEAMATGHAGAGTTIVILDNAADYRVPALGSCFAPGYPRDTCRVVQSFTTLKSYVLDRSSHGTNVAGIAAQVAPGAKIVAADITDSEGRAPVSEMLKGIDWAIIKQAEYNIVSINLSFSERDPDCQLDPLGVMRDAFARARKANILTVVAAGNAGKSDAVGFPACAGNPVVVGALYEGTQDTRDFSCDAGYWGANRVACFSNGGPKLTLFAPGAMIDTGNASMAGNTYIFSGTSHAAPHVAGAIAVLRAPDAAPGDTVDKTVARLTNTGSTVWDHRNGMTQPRLDLYRSVRSIAIDPSPTAVAQPGAALSAPVVRN